MNESFYPNFAFEKSAIIKPDFQNRPMSSKYTRIIIDSRDRNTTLNPNQNEYEIVLDDEIEDVTSAEIIAADVPLPAFIVQTKYGVPTIIHHNGSKTELRIEQGDYTANDISTLYANMLQSSPQSYEVIYNRFKDGFVFSSDQPFHIDFEQSKGIHLLLGFKAVTYVSLFNVQTQKHTIQSQYRKNFDISKAIVLHIDQFSLNHSTNNVTNKSYAIIPFAYSKLNIVNPSLNVKKYFNPPIGRLAKLRIRFYDMFGDPYDFQNQDHYIQIMIESRKHTRRYQDFQNGL